MTVVSASGRPFPIVISAPSGTGKTTIARKLLAMRSDIGYSISATTRKPRGDEVNDVSYHFMTPEAFQAEVDAGEFAEYAVVHGNRYGTLRREVERVVNSGRHVIMDIDVQGAAQFSAAFPDAVQIFVLPPSGAALLARLRGRGTEDHATVARRVRDALSELQAVPRYDYVVVNDDLSRAVTEVSHIVDAEVLRRTRSAALPDLVQAITAVLATELHHLEQEEISDARLHA